MREIIRLIERYCVRHHQRPTLFGTRALDCPTLLDDLKSGRLLNPVEASKVQVQLSQPPRPQMQATINRKLYDAVVRQTAEEDDAKARFWANDPTECAKRFLRRRGHIVFDATVDGPEVKGIYLGKRKVSAAHIRRRAKEQGWDGR